MGVSGQLHIPATSSPGMGHSLSGRGEEKKESLSLLGIEPRSSTVVAILTELPILSRPAALIGAL